MVFGHSDAQLGVLRRLRLGWGAGLWVCRSVHTGRTGRTGRSRQTFQEDVNHLFASRYMCPTEITSAQE